MNIMTSRLLLPAIFIAAGCAASGAELARSRPQTLAGCPSRPNCVSSMDERSEHRIAPFQLKGDAGSAWNAVLSQVRALPRTRVEHADEGYLHATCTSRFFGFIDDLELIRDHDGSVSVRSAARSGYSDFGVNRRRVAVLEKKLREMEVIH